MTRDADPLLNLLLEHGVPVGPIAQDLGIAESELRRYVEGFPVPRRLQARLREVVGRWLDTKWSQAGNLLLAFPYLAKNPEFLKHLQGLNEAHWIVFGVGVAQRTEGGDAEEVSNVRE